jgi:DNA-binding NtrC family response regulator
MEGAQPPHEEGGEGGEGGKQRAILLVDDEEQCLSSGKRLLALLGYEAILAPDGQTAVARYQERRDDIDLVILDMVMPFMDGAETFRQLRAIDPEVRILIASGYIMDDKRGELTVLGVAGFLPKPFDFEEFKAEVQRALAD